MFGAMLAESIVAAVPHRHFTFTISNTIHHTIPHTISNTIPHTIPHTIHHTISKMLRPYF